MSIQVCTEKKLFLLSTGKMSYGMEVTSLGALVNLHWGARLDRVEDLPYGEQLQFARGDEPKKRPMVNQEYPGNGGYFYNEPCLKVMFDNGCRDTKLFYKGYSIETDEKSETLIIEMAEEVYSMTVKLYYRIYNVLWCRKIRCSYVQVIGFTSCCGKFTLFCGKSCKNSCFRYLCFI